MGDSTSGKKTSLGNVRYSSPSSSEKVISLWMDKHFELLDLQIYELNSKKRQIETLLAKELKQIRSLIEQSLIESHGPEMLD